MDDIGDIQAMYDAAWDREDSRLRRHQLEHDMMVRYDSYGLTGRSLYFAGIK